MILASLTSSIAIIDIFWTDNVNVSVKNESASVSKNETTDTPKIMALINAKDLLKLFH